MPAMERIVSRASQQGCIIQAKPHAILPIGDMNDRKGRNESLTSRYQTMRCVFVTQQAERHASLLPESCGFLRGMPWRKRERVSPAPRASENGGWFSDPTWFR